MRSVAGAIAVYAAAHAIVTRAAGPSLALDDVKLNVLAQSFERGYLLENPPLFEWLLRCVQFVLGPSLESFLVVKYAALIAAGCCLFGAARAAGAPARAAGPAALAMVATYQVGVAWHETLTHSTLVFTACAAFLWAMQRHVAAPSLARAAIAGVVAGVGLLSKYSFAPAALALAAAIACAPGQRPALNPRYLLVIISIALAIAFPHLLWKLHLAPSVDEPPRAIATRLLSDAPSAVWSLAAFIAPVAACGWMAGASRSPAGPVAATCWRALGFGGAMLLAAAVGGFGEIDERYAAPFMAPAFVLLALSLDTDRSQARMARIVAAAAVLVLAVRVAALAAAGPPFCEKCRQYIDYAPLKDAIGGGESATLVGFDDHIAGNLRRLYPRARVLSAHLPFYAPPGGRAGDRCLFIWSYDLDVAPPAEVVGASDMVASVTAPRARSFGRKGADVRFEIADFTADRAYEHSLCRLPTR